MGESKEIKVSYEELQSDYKVLNAELQIIANESNTFLNANEGLLWENNSDFIKYTKMTIEHMVENSVPELVKELESYVSRVKVLGDSFQQLDTETKYKITEEKK